MSFLTNKWMNDANYLAQISHVLGAYAFVVTAAFLGGHVPCLIVAGLFVVYAALKEFVYDANFELPKQTWQDNWLDFSMYCVGLVLGLVMVFLVKR